MHANLFKFLHQLRSKVYHKGLINAIQTSQGTDKAPYISKAVQKLVEDGQELEAEYLLGKKSAREVLMVAAGHYNNDDIRQDLENAIRWELELANQISTEGEEDEDVEDDGDEDERLRGDDLDEEEIDLERRLDPAIRPLDPEMWDLLRLEGKFPKDKR